MKKRIYLLLIGILLFGFNVKADMGPPMVARYDVTVKNKDGAVCYDEINGKYTKTSKVLEYGKTAFVAYEIEGKYAVLYYNINENEQDSCTVLTSDIAPKNSQFDIKNTDVEKIEAVKAVILAKGGLNLRKGPSSLYSKILTIPQYSVVTLTYNVGTYWYYADYNGHKGWISGNNQYFGMDDSDILYSITDTKIYDANKKVIGTIPKLTEVTDYLRLVHYDGPLYYVNYNGIKGYVNYMDRKVTGKIRVDKDTNLYDGKKLLKKITKGTTLDFTIENVDEYADNGNNVKYTYYIPSEKGTIAFNYNEGYTIIEEIKAVSKTKGMIGEGLFGEKKVESEEEVKEPEDDTPPEIPPLDDENKEPESETSNKEIIIVALLSAVLGALTVLVIIKLVNIKKGKKE